MFGVTPLPQVPAIQFGPFFSPPPMPRFWFGDPDGEHLLQIQQDRILYNWRRRGEAHSYPGYPELRERFGTEIARIDTFLNRERLGEILPNECEATYINVITLPDRTNPHIQLDRVTPILSGLEAKTDPLELERVFLQLNFLLRAGSNLAGRVYATFTPNFQLPDLSPVVHLEVTGRGKPQANTVEFAFAFLDMAHDAVVRTFATVTTPEMHKHWGRER